MSDAQRDLRAGSRFGPYRLLRLLGRGGMGEVYEAEDTRKRRVVALKLISRQFSGDPMFRARMQREADAAGRLTEPHVVPIHDYGEIDGQLYLDMRLIEGTDLSTMLRRTGPMSPATGGGHRAPDRSRTGRRARRRRDPPRCQAGKRPGHRMMISPIWWISG